VRTLALAAVAWLALLAAMAASGYASPARYAMPAAACACVLAGVGIAALAARARIGGTAWVTLALVAVAALAASATGRLARLDDQVREGVAVARSNDRLRAAVDAAGGPAAVRRCALGGWVAVNHTSQSALAWELKAGLDRVARTMSHPGLVLHAPRSAAAGAPPAVTLAPPLRSVVVARAGAWSVVALRPAAMPLPRACDAQKASGRARRIPNI
jgi:hypothetical protein